MNEKIVFTDQYFSYSQQEVKILTFTYTCNEESRYPVDWNVPGIVPWFYSAHYLTQQGTTIREWVPISSFSLNWSKILLLNYSVYNICGGQILGCVWKYPDKEFIFSINYETHLSCKKNAIHKNLTPPPPDHHQNFMECINKHFSTKLFNNIQRQFVTEFLFFYSILFLKKSNL